MINRLYTVSATVTAVIMATSEREAENRFGLSSCEIKGRKWEGMIKEDRRCRACRRFHDPHHSQAC